MIKPVRNFNRKVSILSGIQNVLWSLESQLPARIFVQVLFRKENKSNDWDGINYNGPRAKIYRGSEKAISSFIRPARKFFNARAKKVVEKQFKWADTQ